MAAFSFSAWAAVVFVAFIFPFGLQAIGWKFYILNAAWDIIQVYISSRPLLPWRAQSFFSIIRKLGAGRLKKSMKYSTGFATVPKQSTFINSFWTNSYYFIHPLYFIPWLEFWHGICTAKIAFEGSGTCTYSMINCICKRGVHDLQFSWDFQESSLNLSASWRRIWVRRGSVRPALIYRAKYWQLWGAHPGPMTWPPIVSSETEPVMKRVVLVGIRWTFE